MNSRNKGAVGERELAKKLREYGFECRRGQHIRKEASSLSADFPEYIAIKVRDNFNIGLFLPTFDNGTMYKGMKAGYKYTLGELKLYDELPF